MLGGKSVPILFPWLLYISFSLSTYCFVPQLAVCYMTFMLTDRYPFFPLLPHSEIVYSELGAYYPLEQ